MSVDPGRSPVRHVVVGPDHHGVVRHALDVARACGHPVIRAATPDAITAEDLSEAEVVHVAFVDALFGTTCEAAAEAMTALADRVHRAGAGLSVTLHDVPLSDSDLDRRRRRCFARIVGQARGVVVSSRTELRALQTWLPAPPVLRMIALPVAPSAPPGPADDTSDTDDVDGAVVEAARRSTVVLGFVYPDRGYESLVDALAPGDTVLAVGRVADGHDAYARRLESYASDRGVRLTITGWVGESTFAAVLAQAAVPVAPNRRIGASASISAWLGAGRRVLVPSSAYADELALRHPGAMTVYEPAELRSALAGAHAALATTWSEGDLEADDLDAVARQYRDHLQACVSRDRAVVDMTTDLVLPGNRWDLVPVHLTDRRPWVSVVIPYYDDQAGLDLVLSALSTQTVAERVDVVVVDDGSPTPPALDAAGELPVRLARQARHGFGAARARNLGASLARGTVLAFLDADTVPERDYLERISTLPAAAPVVTVGRRRHAELSGVTAEQMRGWPSGRPPDSRVLEDPSWLSDGYAGSRDLLDADWRSYRYVISAVMCLPRRSFERVGGFEESFTGYGGEDWELAHRLWQDGSLFAHVPQAVAWHDGPHWARRAGVDHAAVKQQEALTLSRWLPDPLLRGAGQWRPFSHTLVILDLDDVAGVLSTARSALRGGADCVVHLTGPRSEEVAAALGDPRITAQEPTPEVLARAVTVAHVSTACDLSDLVALTATAADVGLVVTPAVVVRATRAVARAACLSGDLSLTDAVRLSWTGRYDADIARLFGRRDRVAPVPAAAGLAEALARLAGPYTEPER